jgi:ribose-phosphate pyrophosphokinase
MYTYLKKDISILAGPSSSDLAIKIAKNLKDIADLVPVDVDIFSDGESKIKINKDIRKKHCIIVQSTYPPTDRHLIQMLMMIKKCTGDGALNICAIIPYLAYARQDKVFLEGEIVSIELVAKLLEAVGTTRLVTVDVHSKRALSYFTIDIQNVSSVPLLANYAANNIKITRPIVVSPDKGGAERAEEFARILKTDMIALNKFCDKNTGEVTIDEKLNFDISNRDIILVDDMISTGGSIIKACEVLKKNRCNKIYAMCAHALLIEDALQKIKATDVVEDIITTNSIPNECTIVDLSPILSYAIRKAITPSR